MLINHPPPGQATKTKWKATQEEVSPQGGRTLYCLGSTHLPMAWIRTPAITHGTPQWEKVNSRVEREILNSNLEFREWKEKFEILILNFESRKRNLRF